MASTRFLQTATVFIVMIVLAKIGHDVLAASLLISFLRAVVLLIFISPLFALGSIAGRQVGEKNFALLPAILQQNMLLAILLSIPPTLLLFFIGPILHWLHQPAALIPLVSQYYHFACLQMPLVLIGTVCAQLLAGIKKQYLVTLVSVFGLFSATFFVLGFGLGYWGFPNKHVIGVGLGVLCSSTLYCIILLTLTLKHIGVFGPIFKVYLKGLTWLKLSLRIGLPIAAQVASQMLSLQFIVFMLGWLGLVAMAASQVSSQYMLFAVVPIFGLAEASSITIGHAYGEKNFSRIHKLGVAGVIVAIAFTLFVCLVFAIFHHSLADVFIDFTTPNAIAIYHLALWLLLIRSISMLFDGSAQVICGALRGLYDTKFPMYVDIFSSWVLMIPLAALFGFGLHWGAIGIALGASFARMVSVGMLVYRWRSQVRLLETTDSP